MYRATEGRGRRNLVNLAATDAALFAEQRVGVRVNRQRWACRSVRRLDERIAEFASQRGLPFALIAAKRDGMHLTIAGHGFVARRLVESGFAGWMREHSRTRVRA